MYRVALIVLLLCVPTLSLSGPFGPSKVGKTKDEYKNHKCVEGVFAIKALKAKLTADEVCRYGKKGCSSISFENKIQAYCEFTMLSECFEKKSWLTIDQVLGVALKKHPGMITYGLRKGSRHEGKTCAFWD